MAYYSSDREKEASLYTSHKEAPFSTIQQLYTLLEEKGWCEYTVYYKKMWKANKKCNGQCNATVLLIQEYFGGDIIKYPNPSKDKPMHYFNRINGCDIDLTSEQFDTKLDYASQKELASNKSFKWDCQKSKYILKLRLGLAK